MEPINWTTTYNGQSPGDLENKNNGFAGRFSGYNNNFKNPVEHIKTKLPNILIIGDSIIGDYCCSAIRFSLKELAEVSILQQPHHCKNIMSWLDTWEVEKWKYDIIFFFDGMHGFPQRVTEEEHQELTPFVIKRLKKATKDLIWGNCTPIHDNFPQGNKNSNNGPNTIDQIMTNESIINRNKSILKVTNENNIPLIDLYSLMKPIQHLTQPRFNDIHYSGKGQIIMGNHISKELKNILSKISIK